jgi:hypothetical protein
MLRILESAVSPGSEGPRRRSTKCKPVDRGRGRGDWSPRRMRSASMLSMRRRSPGLRGRAGPRDGRAESSIDKVEYKTSLMYALGHTWCAEGVPDAGPRWASSALPSSTWSTYEQRVLMHGGVSWLRPPGTGSGAERADSIRLQSIISAAAAARPDNSSRAATQVLVEADGAHVGR